VRRILVVGAGRVGRTIAHLLHAEKGYAVRVADVRPEAARRAAQGTGAEPFPEDAGGRAALDRALGGVDAVVSAAPFTANVGIARAAAAAGIPYLDVTEDVAVTAAVKALARDARAAFVPQCGVAPGVVGIVAAALAGGFDDVESLALRVGALPVRTTNRLKYALTWSTEGLVNEYLNPCEALEDGRLVSLPPLEGREELLLEGVRYEAFTTSGGVGTLCHTYEGRIRRLDYKTIRYPGHLDLVRFLVDDLGFRHRREELIALFERALPATREDVVVVFVRAVGRVAGRLEERTWLRRVAGTRVGAEHFTAIEVATASGALGVLHLLLEGALPARGLVRMEDVPLDRFLATPFGRPYREA
jgi:saccharopine dehydrogenase-like NADP-dependent oxidoreductase